MALPMRRGAAPERRLPPWGMLDPMADFESMWNQMGRLLGQPQLAATATGAWMPMAEEEEAEDAYIVRAELPGISSENVDIELEGNELSITGELGEERRGKALGHRTGRFSYRTTLPSGTDSENIEADLSDGILTVRIPKSDEGKRRKIEIGEHRRISGETA